MTQRAMKEYAFSAAIVLLWVCQASGDRGFMLTAPSQIQAGSTERMCITFHGFDPDSGELFQVELSFNEKQGEKTKVDDWVFTIEGVNHCFDYEVPEGFSGYDDHTVLSFMARGRARNGNYTFQEEQDIYIRKPQRITFIQTDKPKYKPGQTVKLRVLSVDDRLVPQLDNFHLIEVLDPSDITIMQWNDLSVTETQGIADLEIPLSEEPTLGPWTVSVKHTVDGATETGQFRIEEYVLPKYEITVNTKSYLPINAQKVDGEICAMYTYGEPVRGSLSARFCIQSTYSWRRETSRPCVYVNVTEVVGCHDFSVQTSDLMLTNTSYNVYNARLEIFAEITETATGVVLNHTYNDIDVTRRIFNLKFLESPVYFKPGLPYYGRVSVENPDGSPARGEQVSIEFHEYTHDTHFTKLFNTVDDGVIQFSLPALEVDITQLTIQAKMPGYDYDYNPNHHRALDNRASHSIKQWYSPTNSYIQIQPIGGEMACGSEVVFNVSHTAEDEGFVDIYYQIMSRGNLVDEGTLRHTFEEGVLVKPDDSFQEQECPEGERFTTCVSEPRTCENVSLPMYEFSRYPCEAGCFCPWPTNVLHQGSCITQSQCPNYNLTEEAALTRPECPPDQIWNECGSSCITTCDNELDSIRPCIMSCISMCECPPSAPVLHNGLCITRRMCPKDKTRPDRTEVRPIVSVPLRVHINPDMSPLMKMLVYYVKTDRETVADSVAVDVQECTHNKVEIKFADGEKYPGDTTTLKIKADVESLCSVGAVDKSVHILGGKNRLTLSQVMREVGEFDLGEYSLVESESEHCSRYFDKNRSGKRKRRKSRGRGRRSSMPHDMYWPGRYISNYYDSMKAFRTSGVLVLSDMSINIRPCEEEPRPYYYYGLDYMLTLDSLEDDGAFMMGGPELAEIDMEGLAQNSVPEQVDAVFEPVVDIRTYFPETWLWDLHFVGLSGEQDISVTLPHTVTSWVAGGFCTNLHSGIGVSDSSTIKGFQPFFVSLTLPYSVIRNEKINLPVTIFNYLSDCLNVQLTIDQSDEVDIEGDRNKQACVCGQEASTQYFRIAPNRLGDVNVTIRAVSIDNNGICGNRIFATDHVGVRDAVVRTLLVEPEGEPQFYSKTYFVCPSEGEMLVQALSLEMPDNVVPDTPKAMVKVIGDLMGPALDDIDKLLAMPSGCGEQNMLKFAPNIFVMQYLEGVDEVTEEIKTISTKYLQHGYQRELTYRHRDGSYSAFGSSDPSGSMWLTAFVLKSFAQATPLIFIDKENLATSINWVLDQQLENGCFPKVGRVLHKGMKGGLSGDSQTPATLTTYVLIALLEAKPYTQIPKGAITEAFFCIDSYSASADTYTLALMAYAHSLHDDTSAARASVMAAMEQRATIDGDNKYWSAGTDNDKYNPSHYYGDNNAKAMDIEITAYMLLAYMAPRTDASINNGLPLVYWLSKQRNPGGGFSSTQDTVIALQALARYAVRAYTDVMNMNVMVNGTGMQHMFKVDNNNKMIMQKMVVSMPNSLMIQVNGSGCAFVQTSVHYHVLDIPVTEPAFTLTAQVKRVTSTDACRRRDIQVCASYLLDDGYSNMAVISVKMVSGWIPVKDSIKDLMNNVEINLKKHEIEPNLVNFYFDEITSTATCLSFQVEQNVEVDEAKPGYVEVYDYYEKELRISAPYTIRNICGTKQELPELTEEEYNATLEADAKNPFGIEQRRVPIVVPDWGANVDKQIGNGDEVVEEIIVPEVFIPLGQGDMGGPTSLAECPHCYSELPGTAFNRLFCSSSYAYKAAVRDGKYSAKIMSDVRPASGKRRMESFTNFVMDEDCVCSTISNAVRNSKILILQGEGGAHDSTAHSLALSASSHVLPLQDDNERLLSRVAQQCTP